MTFLVNYRTQIVIPLKNFILNKTVFVRSHLVYNTSRSQLEFFERSGMFPDGLGRLRTYEIVDQHKNKSTKRSKYWISTIYTFNGKNGKRFSQRCLILRIIGNPFSNIGLSNPNPNIDKNF